MERDPDDDLSSEIANEARSLYEATEMALEDLGWRHDLSSGEWKQPEWNEAGQRREPAAITEAALESMTEIGIYTTLAMLRRHGCKSEATVIEMVWSKMPDSIKEGRHRGPAEMENEIRRLLATPRNGR